MPISTGFETAGDVSDVAATAAKSDAPMRSAMRILLLLVRLAGTEQHTG
jgi:hypothetical protein